jgi:uncharacterized protein (UPF0147 family)
VNLNLLSSTPPWDWPADAGDTFGQVLKNHKAMPSERLIAADLAGDFTVIDDDLANILLAVLKDPSEPEELRSHAAISFGAALEAASTELDEETGEFDDPEMVPISESEFRAIQEALSRIYSDPATPKSVRRRVLEASVRASQPWHKEAIREAYGSGDRDWMLTAVFAMRFVPGFETETLEALKSTDPEIHREAVMAAGEKELDEAWPHILKLVQDSSVEKGLRIAAIGAIGSIRAEESRGILMNLADSDDEDIAEAADDAVSLMEPEYEEEEEEDEDDEEDEDEE